MSAIIEQEGSMEPMDVAEAVENSRGEPGSLAERIATRRKERERRRQNVLTIPIPGYEDLFAASYRRLTFEEKIEVASQHEQMLQDGDDTVAAAADMLIRGCRDLLEVTGRDENGRAYQSLGRTWSSPNAISDLFGLDGLPAGVTSRNALLEALDSEDLMGHFNAYTEALDALDREHSEALPGESVPSAEG